MAECTHSEGFVNPTLVLKDSQVYKLPKVFYVRNGNTVTVVCKITIPTALNAKGLDYGLPLKR